MEEQKLKLLRKKELGQFFSGPLIAKLLNHLARPLPGSSIIDPMCGIGDMLAEFTEDLDSQLTGVELDPTVYCELERRFYETDRIKLIEGNAFSPSVISQLSPEGYDLVITNPPYVRYQASSSAVSGLSNELTFSQIRKNLIESISHFASINQAEHSFLEKILKNISGLSDLAVPSWILCAMLVKKGGKLAVVVPQTWLNREYAIIINFLLTHWFKVDYIVEDANSSWFVPAQVKTILLVATRLESPKPHVADFNRKFPFVSLQSTARSSSSLVANIVEGSELPEKHFVSLIDNFDSYPDKFSCKKIWEHEFQTEILNASKNKKWYKDFYRSDQSKNVALFKASSLFSELITEPSCRFTSLSDLGISVSQGLRTGANKFFYLNYTEVADDSIKVYPNAIFGVSPFIEELQYFKKVLRKQSELPSGYSLSNFTAEAVALVLRSDILPEDFSNLQKTDPYFKDKFNQLPPLLADYVSVAARTKNGDDPSDQVIPELTAVRPNSRGWKSDRPHELPRFWYMLPDFTKRHLPDLFVPRVNSGRVVTRLNPCAEYLIDANFSTMWIDGVTDKSRIYFFLALLNSTWWSLGAEEIGTVLGGGALKLEATQIKKMIFPVLSEKSTATLTNLGVELSKSPKLDQEIIDDIDKVILEEVVGKYAYIDTLTSMRSGLQKMLTNRSKTHLA